MITSLYTGLFRPLHQELNLTSRIGTVPLQYNFDGIDDYVQLPVIPLFAGDVVEFETRLDSATGARYLIDAERPRTFIYRTVSSLVYSDYAISVSIDGVPIPSKGNVSQFIDGGFHKVTISVIAPASLNFIGCRYIIKVFYNTVIKNLRITRANPTDQYPDLFYPMDDGPGTTVMRQVLPTVDNWDGEYVNFNKENWENV